MGERSRPPGPDPQCERSARTCQTRESQEEPGSSSGSHPTASHGGQRRATITAVSSRGLS